MRPKIFFKETIAQVLLAIIAVSCRPPIDQLNFIPQTSTVSPLMSKTNTPIVLTPTPLATSTKRVLQQSAIECSGHGLMNELTPTFGFQGSLVYYDSTLRKVLFAGGEKFHTWDAPIMERYLNLIGFSPNGEWLAYWISPAKFHITSFQGEQIEFDADPKPLRNFVPSGSGLKQIGWPTWINNQLISLGVNNPRPGQPNYYFMAYLNPFTSEWLLLDVYPLKGFDEVGRGFPSPDLTRILYIQGHSDGTSTLVLFDRNSDAELWDQDNFGNFSIIEGVPNSQIAWAKDSSKVAFVNHEKENQSTITILSRGGQVIHKFVPAEQGGVSSVRWSPDGEFLAIGINESKEETPSNVYISSSILIYNQNLEEITFTCPISAHQEVKDISWIPSTPAIAYYAVNGDVENGRVIFLDLITGISTKIAENVSQFGGWSAVFTR
jgi:hypothetical protein